MHSYRDTFFLGDDELEEELGVVHGPKFKDTVTTGSRYHIILVEFMCGRWVWLKLTWW